MWSYFKAESRSFFSNRKNIAIYLLLLFLSMFYFLQIENNYKSIESVSKSELEASVATKKKFLLTVNRNGEMHPQVAAAIVSFELFIENEEQQLKSLTEKNYKELAKIKSEWYTLNTTPHPLYFKDGNLYAREEAYYASEAQMSKLADYSQMKEEITLNMINDKTAIQSLIRAMNHVLPIVLMIVTLIFSMDLIAKDRKHPSLVKGLPLSDLKKIIVKFIVAFLGVSLSIIPLASGFIGVGLTNGFGHLNLPVAVSSYLGRVPIRGDMQFETIKASQFLLRFSLLMILFITLILLINLLLGFWVKNAYFLFILTLVLPFVELLYNRYGYGDIHSIVYFPTSYVRIGEVLTGHRSFFFSATQLTYNLGVLVLSISVAVLIVLLNVISRKKKMI